MQSHRQRIPKSYSCLRFSSLSWAADREAKLLSDETVCVKGSVRQAASRFSSTSSQQQSTHGELGGGSEAVDSEGVSQMLQGQQATVNSSTS